MQDNQTWPCAKASHDDCIGQVERLSGWDRCPCDCHRHNQSQERSSRLVGETQTDTQRTILRLAEIQGFVKVGGDYIGDVLSLQAQGFITSERNGEGTLTVRLVAKDDHHGYPSE